MYPHRGVSAAPVLPSLRRDTALPARSFAFTIGRFRRWWYSSLPCSTFGGWRSFPTGLLVPRARMLVFISTSSSRARPCSNILTHEAAPEPTLRVLQSVRKPHATYPTPRQPTYRWLHVLNIGLPQGRDKEEGRDEHLMHQIGNHLSYTPYYAACRKRRVTVVVEKTKRTAVTLDIVVDESRNKMADGVTRSPARLCSRRGKICYHKRLEYDFLTLCLAYCFSYFLMPYPGMFIFFVFLRLCSSNHLLR